MSNFFSSTGVLAFSALACVVPSNSALSAATDWVEGDHVRGRLIVATDGIGADGTVTMGIQLRLEEGWETYWRSPGDSGVPPKFDWSETTNLDHLSIAWPAPQRFTILGMNTFGYIGELVLPVTATVPNPSQVVKVRLKATYAVCKDVCFLVEQDFALDIPPGQASSDESMAALIGQYQLAVPDGNSPDFAVERVTVSSGAKPSLEILARAKNPFENPDVIIEGPLGFTFHYPTVRMIAGGRRLILRVSFVQSPGAVEQLVGNMVTITVIDGDRAVQQTLPVNAH